MAKRKTQEKKKARPREAGKTGRFGLWTVVLTLFGIACFMAGLAFLYLSAEIRDRFASRRWSVPSTVFSDTVMLYPGQPVPLRELEDMFERRRYRKAASGAPGPGEYALGRDALTAHLREFAFPGRPLPARVVTFRFQRNALLGMESGGKELAFLELEPMEITRLFGASHESRLLIGIRQAPKYLVDAVVAIEDRRFFEHPGVDWWGIGRALWTDLRARRVVQGGSTITQQLVKNYFLESERTLRRKIVEASMALVLEALYPKDEILEMYLNEIYMGQRGSVAVHGMGEAARVYFGRNVEDLTIPEAATLAGMIRAPANYSPTRHPKACQERRNVVLSRMLEAGFIAAPQYQKAAAEPLRLPETPPAARFGAYFVDYVRRQLQDLYPAEVLSSEGLSIYTSLHPEMTLAAENAVEAGLADLERDHPALGKAEKPLQAALVVLHPKTGAVLALVGGRDYGESSFNRALLARRQPGSAIKPFVYLAGLSTFTLASPLPDEPVTYKTGGGPWSPENYDRRYRGTVTYREALEQSLNVPTVHVAMTVGLPKVIETLRAFGVTSPLEPVPSLALGAFEVTPIELATAYTPFAGEGQRPRPISVREVVTADGHIQQRRTMDLVTVTSPARAFLVTSMLEGAVERGTATAIRKAGLRFPCAGKTGTTSDYIDSWFVGYTTDALAAIWVGFDDNTPTKLSGATGALKLWIRYFARIQPWISPQAFPQPPGVAQQLVCTNPPDPQNPSVCPDPRREYFLMPGAE